MHFTMSENALARKGERGSYFTRPNPKFTRQCERASGILHPCSATQVPFSLASLTKILISETIIKIVPAVVCINGLNVPLRVAVYSQGISRLNAENCTAFPPPLDSQLLRSRIA